MSLLLHDEIIKSYEEGKILIQPYNQNNIGPNSYDVRLDKTLKIYKNVNDEKNNRNNELILDCKKKHSTVLLTIPEEGLILYPGNLYLGCTIEKIGSDYYVPMYEGRSSLARLGIMSHCSAGFGDIGFKSFWTTEIQVILPVRIYPNMRIGQVYFHNVNQEYNKPENRYHGKYVNQTDAQESKFYEDFKT